MSDQIAAARPSPTPEENARMALTSFVAYKICKDWRRRMARYVKSVAILRDGSATVYWQDADHADECTLLDAEEVASYNEGKVISVV